MLVLTRKTDERIVIGNITVTVVAVKKGRVRLGVEAPRDLVVMREEIANRKSKIENRKLEGVAA